MENYSPSHPTDEIDFDSPCNENINNFEMSDNSDLRNIQCKEFSSGMEFQKSRSRSRSRKRKSRSRSRSKNRRSRSRNKSHKVRDYSYNNISRRGRSKEGRSVSKGRSHSREYKQRNIDKRSRSRDKRSRSNGSKKHHSKSKDSSNNYYPKSKDSPSQFRSNDRKNDNIFSKLCDLDKNSSEQVKSKWNYDSDEENLSTKQDDTIINESTNRYDKKPFPRKNYEKEISNVSNINENDDTRPFPRRFEYNSNRRNFDKTRGFGRNRTWEPRNNRSRYPPRNGSNFNRNNFGFNNNEDNKDRWENAKSNDFKSDFNKVSQTAWNDNDDNLNIEKSNKINNSPFKESFQADVQQDRHGFAMDSDEECGNWGKEIKTSTIDEMLTIANLESQGLKKVDIGRKVQNQPSPNNKWSNKESNLLDNVKKNKFAENSDEEYGAWGSEQKSVVKNVTDSRTNNQDNDNSNICDKVVVISDKQVKNDSDDDYGSWGKDRTSFTTNQSSDVQREQCDTGSSYSQPFYSQNQRPNFYRNNEGNQRFSQRRGGNNNFNRFQRPNQNYQQQERFNYNAGNLSNTHNFTNNFNVKPQHELMPQMPIPPYNFNPSQRPPQWTPINNMNCPPICNGQIPFTSMPLMPQMQFPQMTQQQQPPPISIPNMMQTVPYIPPPPPSTNQISGMNINSESNNFNPPVKINDSTNLLETIMTNVGLSSKSIRMPSDILKPSAPVSDSLSNIIKSAASTVLSRLVENSQKSNNNNVITGNVSDNMSMSPPSPSSSSPQARHIFDFPGTKESSEFVLPPLPNYSDILKPSNTNLSTMCTTGGGHGNNILSQTTEISEEKRNRSDFESKGDWQERIALEVKNFLKPAYMNKRITKTDYKEIMKRCVTKISRSGVTEINTEKIEKFVLSYVDKYQKLRKVKQHGVVSSSEHELVM